MLALALAGRLVGAQEPESATAESLLREAEVYRASGRHAHAERAFRQAQQRAQAAGEPELEILALTGLGGTLLSAGQLPAAGAVLDDALLRARSRSDSNRLVAAIQNERGNLLSRQGQAAEALGAYDEARSLAAREHEHVLAARAAANGVRTTLSQDASPPDPALAKRIDTALEHADAVEDASLRAGLLIHVGASLRDLAHKTGERAHWMRAAALFQSATELAAGASDLHSLSYAQGYLGELYESDQRWSEALELAGRALAAADSAGDPAARYRWLWLQGRVLRSTGNRDAALAAYRAAVAAVSELRQALGAQQGAPAASIEEAFSPIVHECVDLLLQRAARDDDAEAQALLVEARATLEKLKYAEVQDYFRDACVREQRAIGNLSGALVIYPVLLADRIELIAEWNGRLHRYASPVPESQVKTRVRELRRALETRTTRDYQAPARDVYDWLFRPVEQGLPDGAAIDTVVYVPGGVLRTIPMGALLDRESGRFLIEKHPLAVTPGLTLTEPRGIGSAEVDLLAAGITQAVQGFPALDSVASELAAARGVFANTASLVDREYTADSLRTKLSEHPFGIVHIASHGEFRGDVTQSFLLTFDSKLSMDELAGLLEVTQQRERPVELLTLSACSTAAGDERAALGLAGVAVRAGARSALATLWPVNDEAAAQLIGVFYRELGEGRLSRARALQRAQLELIGEKSLRHPFYWAPFLLINSWL